MAAAVKTTNDWRKEIYGDILPNADTTGREDAETNLWHAHAQHTLESTVRRKPEVNRTAPYSVFHSTTTAGILFRNNKLCMISLDSVYTAYGCTCFIYHRQKKENEFEWDKHAMPFKPAVLVFLLLFPRRLSLSLSPDLWPFARTLTERQRMLHNFEARATNTAMCSHTHTHNSQTTLRKRKTAQSIGFYLLNNGRMVVVIVDDDDNNVNDTDA